jgi:hypothetical protein
MFETTNQLLIDVWLRTNWVPRCFAALPSPEIAHRYWLILFPVVDCTSPFQISNQLVWLYNVI